MNDSIIVLGGSGFLGKALIESLIKHGFKNIASASQHSKKTNNKVKNIVVNILDRPQFKKAAIPYKIIINCTGQISNPITECFRLNSEGITNLALIAKKTEKKVFHISTVGLYGTAKKVNEDSPINPETPYSVCKSFAEYILQKELPVSQLTIVRLSNVYGMESKGIFGYLYRSFYTDRRLIINNNGDLSRYFIEINDAADNIVNLIMKKNNSGIYNLVGNEKYTIKQLIKKIEYLTKVKFRTFYETNNKPYENIDYISDVKINKLIKTIFSHTVKEFIIKYFVRNKTI
jgi:nucleoside-diphosphate-sugar epimerase